MVYEHPPETISESISGGGWGNPENQLRFYGTKTILSAASTVAATPDFVIRGRKYPNGIQIGQTLDFLLPFNGFLKQESGKTNLYLFRQSFKSMFAPNQDDPNTVNALARGFVSIFFIDLRYGGALRTDKIDVTKLNAGTTGTTPPPGSGGGTPPGGSGSNPPPLAGGGACFQQFRNLCDQVQSLRDQLCKLVPTLSFCKAGGGTPAGGGGGGGGGSDQNGVQNAL
jgi:hypothetical protein